MKNKLLNIAAVTAYGIAFYLIGIGVPIRKWKLIYYLPKSILARMAEYGEQGS